VTNSLSSHEVTTNAFCVFFEAEVRSTPRNRAVHFTEYLVNAPPAWVSEFGPSAA
jgi:hypothetical protein